MNNLSPDINKFQFRSEYFNLAFSDDWKSRNFPIRQQMKRTRKYAMSDRTSPKKAQHRVTSMKVSSLMRKPYEHQTHSSGRQEPPH